MFTRIVDFRKNSVAQWAPTDSEKNYRPNQEGGTLNYSKDAFDYQYNSDGFRCSEFTEKSDFPILYAGCSFTEGIGLPLDHCWPHYFSEIVKEQPGNENFTMPLHSVAVGGTGVDFAADMITRFTPIVKPKLIVGYFCSMYRREFCMQDYHLQQWFPNIETLPPFKKELQKIFSDQQFALYQTFRSLQTISLSAQLHRSKAFVFFDDDTWLTEEFAALFPEVTIRPVPIVLTPATRELDSLPLMARDNAHHGAKWQHSLATLMADTVIPTINPSYRTRSTFLPPLLTNHPPSPSLAVRVLKEIPRPSWLT